uniref:Uncharacterized protein n=1 Tax=Oryza barthii TaxID=65489 RepID=A0A0D3F3X8_9ORYZ
MSVQLLSFACGGFAVVWATNHLLGDDHIAVVLLRSWSELALTGTFAGGLNLDRSVLSRPRSPPMYSAAVDGMFVPWDHEHEVNPLTAEASFVERLYFPGGDAWIVSAYVWPRLAAALENDRRRVFKPLTAEFLGLTGEMRRGLAL